MEGIHIIAFIAGLLIGIRIGIHRQRKIHAIIRKEMIEARDTYNNAVKDMRAKE